MDGKKPTIATLALALLAGCASGPDMLATFQERDAAYKKVQEKLKDGTSLQEAKLATRMYFDSSNAQITKSYTAEQTAAMADWQKPLMNTIEDFYNADGEVIMFAQKKDGEGKNARIQSTGTLEKIAFGTLPEFKKHVEDYYKSIKQTEKVDGVLRGVVRVAQTGFTPVRAHINRKYNVEQWNNTFTPIELGLFKYILAQNKGKIGPEENPELQITSNDGNFVYAGVGAIVYKGTVIEPAKEAEKTEKEKSPIGMGIEWSF